MSDEYQLRKDIDRIYDDIYDLQTNEVDVYKKGELNDLLKNTYYDKSEVDTKINQGGGGGGDLSNYYTKSEINGILSSYVTSQTLEDYQPLLESGVNIKTINNQSLLGSGNISIGGGGGSVDIATSWGNPLSDEKVPSEKLAKTSLDDKVNRSELYNLDINLTTLELVPKATNPNGVICFDDLQNKYIETSSTSGLIRNDGTIDTTQYLSSLPSHNHDDRYYTESEVDSALNGKADSVHTHNWDSVTGKPSSFPPSTHNHDDRYYTENEVDTALNGKADSEHTHTVSDVTDFPTIPVKTSDLTNDGADGTNVFVSNNDSRLSDARTPLSHTHDDRYYTESEIDTALNTKANSVHTHDDRYYTENEVDTALNGKADSVHTHDSRYYTIDYLDAELSNKADYNHTHTISDVSNLQTSLNGKQATLVSGTNIKTINNESLLGTGNINISGSGEQNVFYGTCSTGASTQTKVVTVDDWSFTTGNVLFVKFDDYNKYNGTAKISIGGVTKDIATVGTTKTSRYYWKAGEVVGFVYDGTNMIMLEQGTATTTYYGVTKLSSSTSSTSETLSATPKAVKTAYDLADSKADSEHTHTVSDVTDFPTIPSKTSDLTNDGSDGTNAFVSNNDSRLSDARTPTTHNHNITDLNNVSYDTWQINYTDSTSTTVKILKYTGS